MSFSSSQSAACLLICAAFLSGCGGSDPDAAESLQSAAALATAWRPRTTDTWQWQLTGSINTTYDVDVYDIDLFETPRSVIRGLKAQGRRVVCYFSAGSSENWRPDFSRFVPADLGRPLDGWAGERWLDTRSANVRGIMQSRLDLAVEKGCDGVEPDNVDAYANAPGFPLTVRDQLEFDRFLAREAHARGLVIGLKNAVELVTRLAPAFDFAVNEQCHQYRECEAYAGFIADGKPVFNAEYAGKWATYPRRRTELCAASMAQGMRTLVLPLALDDSFRYSCD